MVQAEVVRNLMRDRDVQKPEGHTVVLGIKLPGLFHLLRGRFGRGVLWNLVGTISAQGAVFLTSILLARLLGKDIFGELGMIQSTLLTLTSIAQVSTGLTATKYVAEFRDTDRARTGRVLGLCSSLTLATGVVATMLLLVSAPWIAEHVLVAPRLAVSLSISAAFVLFSVMNGYQIGALAGLESYKNISIYVTFLGIVHLLVCVLGAAIWGLNGAIGGMTVSALLRWGLFGLALRREIGKQGITILHREGWKEQKILHEFMLPATLSGLTAMPAIWLGNALLVQQTNGYAELGIYNAVNNIRLLMLIMPALLNGVGVAVLNNKFGNQDRVGYFGLFYANIKVTTVMALVGTMLMASLSATIPRLYGMESNHFSMMLVILLAFAIIPEALSVSLYQLIQASGKMWTSFFLVALPRDVMMIALAIVLIPKFGGVGWALAYTLSWGMAFVVIVILVFRFKSQLKFKV